MWVLRCRSAWRHPCAIVLGPYREACTALTTELIVLGASQLVACTTLTTGLSNHRPHPDLTSELPNGVYIIHTRSKPVFDRPCIQISSIMKWCGGLCLASKRWVYSKNGWGVLKRMFWVYKKLDCNISMNKERNGIRSMIIL